MLELDFETKQEGFILGMPDYEYRRAEGLNASSLKTLARDPFTYFAKIDTPKSDAMIEGTLMHTLFLEPHLFEERFIVSDSKTKSFLMEAEGKDIIKYETYDNMLECVDYVKTSLKNDLGIDLDLMDSEVSFFGEFRGLKAKCRADKLTKNKRACFDLKKTRDASTKGFIKQACDLDYCIQEYFYKEVMGLEAFNWLAICTKPLKDRAGRNHYRYNILQASPEFSDKGKQLVDLALEVLENKERFNRPMYPSEFLRDDLDDDFNFVKALKPPLWYMV